MNKYILLTFLFSFMIFGLQAQFVDDMEYQQGEPLGPWWYGCDPPLGDCIVVTTGGQSGSQSGYVTGGVVDQLLDLGNKTTGEWALRFYMYVPAGKSAYYTMLGEIPPVGGGQFIVGNIFFNEAGASPGTGSISDTALGTVNWNYPEAMWFEITMNIDLTDGINLATWEFIVDGAVVIPEGTPFTNSANEYPTSLGGLNYFSVDSNYDYYVDDFVFQEGFITPTPDFTDGMEYANGIPSENNWWYCPSGSSCDIEISTNQARNGDYSGLISDDGTSAQLLYLGNNTFGNNGLEFYMYIPTGKEAAFHIADAVHGGSSVSVVGSITFNNGNTEPGVGTVTDSALGSVDFNFPHDQWFRLVMNVDMSLGMPNATWHFVVNGEDAIPKGTAFTNIAGDIPASLGGIIFYSASAENEMYLDDFNYVNGEIILGVASEAVLDFVLFPNPANDVLEINSVEEIDSIRLYSLQGALLKEVSKTTNLTVSELSQGLYFVEVISADLKSTQRFIKE